MNIRIKITLWLCLVAILPASALSYFGYYEFWENIRIENRGENLRSAKVISKIYGKSPEIVKNYETFWLHIYDNKQNILYSNEISKKLNIPFKGTKEPYEIIRDSNNKGTNIFDKFFDKFFFKYVNLPFSDVNYLMTEYQDEENGIIIQIGRPMIFLNSELIETKVTLIIGVLVTLLGTLLLGYVVAGRILAPLVQINNLITKIQESSLNTRIPLGKSKDELYELGTTLNHMLDRIEHSFHRQKEFIGNAAHELKSPLTVLMLSHEEMLSNDLPTELRTALVGQLSTMQRLSKLVRDLLSIARLEAEEKINKKPTEIRPLIEDIAYDYQDYIKNEAIEFTIEGENVSLMIDKEMMTRVFINLLDNAIKYNYGEKRWIKIGIKTKGANLLIDVSNSSNNISRNKIKKVFEQFYRIETSRSQQYGGTGLGLTIVEKIIIRHRGTITATSENSSTLFQIHLPCDRR